MKILVVEDDSVSALVLRKALEKLGYDVTVAGDGEAAVPYRLNIDVDLDVAVLDHPRLAIGHANRDVADGVVEHGHRSISYARLRISVGYTWLRINGKKSVIRGYCAKPCP